MLIGTYKNNIGEKNRIAFPKKFKNESGTKLIVTKGYDKCLVIVDAKKFNTMLGSIKDIPFVNSDIRDTKRFLVGSAQEVELDSQGRFVLPIELKKYASLSNEAAFLGLIDWVELWDSEVWAKKENEINKNSAEISNKLSKLLTEK